MAAIFLTGDTGYTGRRLIKDLVKKGNDVTVLVQKGSEQKLPPGTRAIIADPFSAPGFQQWIPKGAVFIHLPAAPSANKKENQREIDLRSLKTAADAALHAGVSHFIYVSIAMADSKFLKDQQTVCREAEAYLQTKNLVCTVIRPWRVMGPGRLSPALFLPVYGVARLVPAWRQKAEDLSPITLGQLVATIEKAIASPPKNLRVFEIKHIKRKSLPAI